MDSQFVRYIEPVFESLCEIARKKLIKSIVKEDNKEYIFPMMFMVSRDKGYSFQWYLTEKQKEYVIKALKKKKVSMPSDYFEHWIKYKFITSGLVSYLRDTCRKTEYIEDFKEEEILINLAYKIDKNYPDNDQLIRGANEKKLCIPNPESQDELKEFESIWGFSKIPFFYFEIFDEQDEENIDNTQPLTMAGQNGNDTDLVKDSYRIYGIVPCHELSDDVRAKSLDVRAKYMMRLLSLIEESETYIESSYSLRQKIEANIRLTIKHAMKSAIAAIMSRNGSHNIGSHVINRVVEAMDSLKTQDHKYFLRYLQQRMDFVAQISTEFSQWTTSHWFVKEIMRGFYEQTHLINYIARSEGLKAYDGTGESDTGHIKCIIKNVKKYSCNNGQVNCTSPNACHLSIDCIPKNKPIMICRVNENTELCNEDLSEDILISIPGGIVGFHAFYTILENFLRNSAKHCYATHPIKDHDMTITIEVWNYDDDPEQYTVRIWDNYSYVSGSIKTSLDKTHSADKLGNKKLIIYLPEGPQFSCDGCTITKFDGAIPTSTDSSIMHFIVDSCELSNEYRENLYARDDIRFIEAAYWSNYCEKVISEMLSAGDDKLPYQSLLAFLSNYYIPSHIVLNNTITQSLIDQAGSLKKANWGVAEMKIATGYLQGHSIELIGGEDKNNLELLLRAISIPDNYLNRRIYRLGYEFHVRKPVDVLIIASEAEAKDLNINELKKGAIVVTSSYEDNNSVDSAMNRSGEITVIYGESDELVSLLGKEVEVGEEAKRRHRKKVIQAIEKFGKFRLFIILDKKLVKSYQAVKNNIASDKLFYSKRIVLLTKQDFKNEMVKDEEGNDISYSELKSWLYLQWIKHIQENICNIPGKINLVIDPFSTRGDSPKGQAINRIDEELILNVVNTIKEIINRVCNAGSIFDDDNDLTNKIKTSLENNKDALNPAGAVAKEIVYRLCSKYMEKDEYQELYLLMQENMIDKIKRILGINGTGYYPSTLPRILKEDKTDAEHGEDSVLVRYKNNIDKYYSSNINYFSDLKTTDKYIRYKRHKKFEEEDIGAIYCEDLSGGAAHFQSLCHLPKDEHNLSFLICNLIENGLLRIGLADERIYEAATKMGTDLDILKYAGVEIIGKICDLYLGEGSKNIGGASIDIEDGKVILKQEVGYHILIIHQGILDKINVDKFEGNNRKERIDTFINLLREHIPFICITSGRGKPPELPEGTKFLTFSIIETSLLSKPHSKLTLMKQIL